jgi:hypothetical protein
MEPHHHGRRQDAVKTLPYPVKTGHGAALLLAAALLAACGPGSPPVARVNKHPIAVIQVQQELSALLWRRGEKWEDLDESDRRLRQREAADSCVNQYLLATFAAQQPVSPAKISTQADTDFQEFLKQFEPPDEWEKRAKLQGLNANTLKSKITTETSQTLALESWLSQQSPKVTEADARAWYDSHHASMMIPECVRASQIFLTRHDVNKPERKDELAEISKQLKADPGTFKALVTKYSDDDGSKTHGGDMGWFSRERIPPEFAEKVFVLPVGRVSDPIESHLGWHFVLVQEKRPARLAEFAEMKEEITQLLEAKWRESKLKQLTEKLRVEARIEIIDAALRSVEPG